MSYRLSPYLKSIVIASGFFAAAVGILVMIGWMLDNPVLKSLNPDYISMKPNTAFCFILSGISIVCLHDANRLPVYKILARSLLVIVLLISTVNLLEYLFNWNAGIDEFLFSEGQGSAATIFPGRMALNTIICFVLLSVALLIIDIRLNWVIIISQLFAVFAFLLSILPQFGYAYNKSDFFTIAFQTPMALNTAISILTLSIGAFFIRPTAGLLNVLSSEGTGGFFARRLFPILIILPVLFLWIRLAIQISGYQLQPAALGIVSIFYIGLFIAAHWKTIKSLNDLDLKRQISEKQLLLAHEILGLLNKNEDSKIMISGVIGKIKEQTGIEAVAIRLKDGEDYPYFATSGFTPAFVEAERYLCHYDEKGNIERDATGNPLLECMCGNILCGRVDSSKSFFTENGSFRSNNTTQLLATTSDAERLTRTRNRCNSAGYESVALIPIKSGEDIIGLLQLNDHRINAFNQELIPFFEGLSSNIGIALMRNRAVSDLSHLNEELEQRVLERTHQLNDSNKELESFAYSVSHDLRAPLRHIIGFTEILESGLKDVPNEEIPGLTGIIKNSAVKMGKLIDELISYSRIGTTDLKSADVSLQQTVNEVILESTDITRDRNIEWKISDLPDVKGDRTLLYLVFQNLINNALKFTNKKEKAIIEIYCDDTLKREYRIFVKDNGAGFNMAYAEKLFGVFQRLHSSNEFDGTGIGLATVKRIVKRHGGRISAEGKENEGAQFCFTLPKYSTAKSLIAYS